MKILAAAVAGLGFVVSTSPVAAHHSFTAQFTDQDPVDLKGVLSKVDWINPHIYIYIDVKDNAGAVTTWALEGHPTRWMAKAGLTKSMLPIGQAVVFSAFRAKDGTKNLGYLRKITFPDGHFYQLFTDDAVLR